MCITEESYHSGGLQKEKEKLKTASLFIVRQNYRQAKRES